MKSFPEDWLKQIKDLYPRRSGGQGWGALERLMGKIEVQGSQWSQVMEGVRSYRAYCDREGLTGTHFVKQAKTFFGADGWWQESYEPEAKPKLPAEIALERRWQALRDRADLCGFRSPDPLESADVYETSLRFAERGLRAVK